MGKRKLKERKEDDNEYDPVSKHLVTGHIKNQEKRLIIILENAQLESVKVSFYLINKFNLSMLNIINILV